MARFIVRKIAQKELSNIFRMKKNALFFRVSTQAVSLFLLIFSVMGILQADHLTDMNDQSKDTMPAMEVDMKSGEAFSYDENESIFVEDGDTLTVKSQGTDLSYDITEIRANAGSTITIRYDNASDMPHNIVFVNSRQDIQPVGVAGIQARETDYVPQDEANQERIFGSTALAKPGYTEYVTITVPEPGTYPYICTYPGHFTMMQGDLISE